MTSPTQRAGAGVRRWALNFSPYRVARMIEHALGQFVSYDDYAALQARIAELEARSAASERDAVDDEMVGRALRSYWCTKGKTFSRDKCCAMRRALEAALKPLKGAR